MAENPYAQFVQPRAEDNPYAQFVQQPAQGPGDAVPAGQSRATEDVPTMGAGEAALLGGVRGLSFGFGDEIAGTARASGLQSPANHPYIPLIIGAGRLAYERLFGEGEATQKYNETVEAMRAANKQAEAEQPAAHIGGQIAGGLAAPVVGAARTAVSLPARMVGGAAAGGAAGGLTGAGEGETLQERAIGAGVGTGVGAGVGAALPAVGAAVGQLPFVRQGIEAARGLFTREDEAARRVAAALRADERFAAQERARAATAGREPRGVGLTAQEYAQESAAGTPVAAIDRLGPQGLSLARSAANTSPEARGALENLTADRYQTAGGRVSQWMRQAFNYPDSHATEQALARTAREVNPPAYRRAEAEAARLHPGGLWDEGFDQITQAPVVQDAIRKASITGSNRAAREGFTPIGNPFTLDRTTGRMTLREDARPTLAFWDEVKKNLDKVGTRDSKDFSRVLREHLDELVPSYAEARAGAARFFNAENALDAGKNFANKTDQYALSETTQALRQMSDTDRRLFHDGFAEALIDKLDKGGNAGRTKLLNDIQNSPSARRQMTVGLGGEEQYNRLATRLRVEAIMDRARLALGNSTTARQWAELGLAGGRTALIGGVGGGILGDFSPSNITIGALFATTLKAGHHRINQNVARRVGELLASSDPATINRGIELLSRNSTLRQALISADNATARIAGQQAATRRD